jgi:hypothetical protein
MRGHHRRSDHGACTHAECLGDRARHRIFVPGQGARHTTNRRDLGVRYVVRGSVRRLGPMLRVNAELGSTETGAQLWSDSFDQKVADLALGQEQIVVRMRTALNISLTDIEATRSLKERPTSPDAFDLILRARAIMLQPHTKDRLAQAVGLYQQALAHDPKISDGLVSWGRDGAIHFRDREGDGSAGRCSGCAREGAYIRSLRAGCRRCPADRAIRTQSSWQALVTAFTAAAEPTVPKVLITKL